MATRGQQFWYKIEDFFYLNHILYTKNLKVKKVEKQISIFNWKFILNINSYQWFSCFIVFSPKDHRYVIRTVSCTTPADVDVRRNTATESGGSCRTDTVTRKVCIQYFSNSLNLFYTFSETLIVFFNSLHLSSYLVKIFIMNKYFLACRPLICHVMKMTSHRKGMVLFCLS